MGISKRLGLFVAFVLLFWCYGVPCDEVAVRGAPSGVTPPNEEKANKAEKTGKADKANKANKGDKGDKADIAANSGNAGNTPGSEGKGQVQEASVNLKGGVSKEQAAKGGTAISVASGAGGAHAKTTFLQTNEKQQESKDSVNRKDGGVEKAGALRSGSRSGEAKDVPKDVPKEDAPGKSTNEEFYDQMKKQHEEEKSADMNFLKILSIGSSVFMQLVLFPSIFKIIKKKTTGEVDGLPYVVLLFSSFLWLVYGMLLNNSAIVCPNLVGLVLGAFYSLMYHKYCKNMWLRQKLFSYYKICGFICFLLYAFLYVLTYEQYELFVGFMAFISSIINFGAPLSYVQIVIKKKNSSLIPLEIATGSLVCSFLWVTYGFTIKDGFVIVPNLCGFILSLLQIALILLYSNKEAIVNYDDGDIVDFVSDGGGIRVNRNNRYSPTENHIFLNEFNLDEGSKMGSAEVFTRETNYGNNGSNSNVKSGKNVNGSFLDLSYDETSPLTGANFGSAFANGGPPRQGYLSRSGTAQQDSPLTF
ncbi:hypothetical protein C922_02732 [Plasmodium inui San Antonio 1]|uniref:Sugar transporter SWEET1 n=1 Tax=Plasmodium inui San Antonio 1 TaxID=1237626 RepID=W7A0P6_9APIC|nr:hypothetical protein C922_02732 [Plasmodium inui San Antonio 1]EUD66747.1 hypothetical protein C922_02732 [Plasmodium inui San Antonio 1]